MWQKIEQWVIVKPKRGIPVVFVLGFFLGALVCELAGSV